MTGGVGPARVGAAAHAFVSALDKPVLAPEDRHHLERVLRLRRGDLVSRAAAAEALGYLGFSQGIPAVKAALTDPEASVRGAALRSFAVLSGKGARPFIEEYLRSETDPAVRETARTLLSSM